MRSKPTRILCVDDHAFLVDGLRARFDLESDLEFAGHLTSAASLTSEAKRLRPDIILLDIEMPGPDPFEAAEDLCRMCPGVKTVFLSAYVRDHYISAALKSGAWGYFSKSETPDEIVAGIRKIAAGEFCFSPKVQTRCKPADPSHRGKPEPRASRLDLLTVREQEVLRLIGKGMTRSEIAAALCRSPKTIDGHRESIMEKLCIHDRAELVRFAIREGMAEV